MKTLLHITVILRPEFLSKACHTFTRNKVVKDNCKGIDAMVRIVEYWTNTEPGQRNINAVNRQRKHSC